MKRALPEKGIMLGVLVLAFGAIAIWQGSQLSDQIVVDDLRNEAEERLNLYQSTLDSALTKYSYLPFLIARDESVRSLLVESSDGRGGASVSASRSLSEINAKSGTDVLFVLDQIGTTLAASNWQAPLSFVGRNYAFRPYFTDAIEGHEGRLFAIGATTGKAGYFMSHPVEFPTGVAGVAVVKIDLDPLQRDWRDGGEAVFVSDNNGVIFLSSQEQWNFRTLAPLSPETRSLIQEQQQYRGQDLIDLEIRYGESADAKNVRIDDRLYLHFSRPLNELGWRMHYLSPADRIENNRLEIVFLGIAGMTLLATLLLYWREREQKIISRRRAREAEKFSEINRLLEIEVEERRAAELELRETQAELVQAGKLAALGEMSAAIAHEINQPIAAIRMFGASARLMLEKGMTGKLDQTLGEISNLTERMGIITGQLKTFARKAPTRLDPLDIRDAIKNVEKMMMPQAREEQSQLIVDLLTTPVIVEADIIRLEQVFINLLRNALDAVRNRPEKTVTVVLKKTGAFAEVQVFDTGPGIPLEVQERLFDPFFTTKDVGEGVGLGLSITYGIVTDLGGDIRVSNASDGGAEFTVRFPLCGNVDD